MLTLDQFLDSCAHETRVMQHLGTKVPPDSLDYRPSETQRSMLELMQYVTVTALPPMAYLVDGDWDRAPEFGKLAQKVAPANFSEALDAQMATLRRMAEELRGRDLESEQTRMPWGEPCTLGEFLVNAVVKALACYRMQFFCYCKGAGATGLGSAQCWIGIDPPPR